MLILLYIVYITLYFCDVLEVHASYPLKYVTNTYYNLKTSSFNFPTLPSVSFFLSFCVLFTLDIEHSFIISNKIH